MQTQSLSDLSVDQAAAVLAKRAAVVTMVKRAGLFKTADGLGQTLSNYWKGLNPAAQGGLIGAGIGGVGGLGLGAVRRSEDDDSPSPWSTALTGALAGGGIGAGIGAMQSGQAKLKTESPAANNQTKLDKAKSQVNSSLPASELGGEALEAAAVPIGAAGPYSMWSQYAGVKRPGNIYDAKHLGKAVDARMPGGVTSPESAFVRSSDSPSFSAGIVEALRNGKKFDLSNPMFDNLTHDDARRLLYVAKNKSLPSSPLHLALPANTSPAEALQMKPEAFGALRPELQRVMHEVWNHGSAPQDALDALQWDSANPPASVKLPADSLKGIGEKLRTGDELGLDPSKLNDLFSTQHALAGDTAWSAARQQEQSLLEQLTQARGRLFSPEPSTVFNSAALDDALKSVIDKGDGIRAPFLKDTGGVNWGAWMPWARQMEATGEKNMVPKSLSFLGRGVAPLAGAGMSWLAGHNMRNNAEAANAAASVNQSDPNFYQHWLKDQAPGSRPAWPAAR